MGLVDAWDKRTGKRVPHLVPEHHIGHKIFGPHMVPKPPAKKAATTDTAGKAATKKEDSDGTDAR